jgi:hypothetical protein
MKRLDLGNLTPSNDETCHDCGVFLTDANRSAAEQIRQDGQTQGLCQNCYRRDDVADLRDLLGDR